MDSLSPLIQTDTEAVRRRYETLLSLYVNEFSAGLGKEYTNSLFLSKELLHCAVNAYFDDICKYKAYAGSEFADRHKQAAYTMIWISRFKPIQIVESARINTTFLTINEAFAIFAGLMFLNPSVMKGMTESFYNHLIYSLTYRETGCRALATILYLMEKASVGDIKY
ncbi:MAG: hypothetical protein K2G85_02560 [Muribaculaceae bacterium]|nr:hypothetical protein [Muribaculaceae bacterium]